MPTISLDVSDDMAAQLAQLAQRCTQAHEARNGATTQGPLQAADLLAMLAGDAAMVIGRSGSWEGTGMAQLLTAHGSGLN